MTTRVQILAFPFSIFLASSQDLRPYEEHNPSVSMIEADMRSCHPSIVEGLDRVVSRKKPERLTLRPQVGVKVTCSQYTPRKGKITTTTEVREFAGKH